MIDKKLKKESPLSPHTARIWIQHSIEKLGNQTNVAKFLGISNSKVSLINAGGTNQSISEKQRVMFAENDDVGIPESQKGELKRNCTIMPIGQLNGFSTDVKQGCINSAIERICPQGEIEDSQGKKSDSQQKVEEDIEGVIRSLRFYDFIIAEECKNSVEFSGSKDDLFFKNSDERPTLWEAEISIKGELVTAADIVGREMFERINEAVESNSEAKTKVWSVLAYENIKYHTYDQSEVTDLEHCLRGRYCDLKKVKDCVITGVKVFSHEALKNNPINLYSFHSMAKLNDYFERAESHDHMYDGEFISDCMNICITGVDIFYNKAEIKLSVVVEINGLETTPNNISNFVLHEITPTDIFSKLIPQFSGLITTNTTLIEALSIDVKAHFAKQGVHIPGSTII